MSKTALVLLDLQQGLVDRFPEPAAYLARVSKTVTAARAAKVNIIYVKTCFRPNHPEISSRNFTALRIASLGGALEGDPFTEISADIAPLEHDIVVIKRRVSAFAGSDLDVVLRGLNVENLVLTGIATSGAVLSTVRHGADLDFAVTVLDDLCLDGDAEVHRVLVEKVFTRQGHVMNAEQWVQGLENKT